MLETKDNIGGWAFPFTPTHSSSTSTRLRRPTTASCSSASARTRRPGPTAPLSVSATCLARAKWRLHRPSSSTPSRTSTRARPRNIRRDWYRSDVRGENSADKGVTVIQLLRPLKQIELRPGRMELAEEEKEDHWPRAMAYNENGLTFSVGSVSLSSAAVTCLRADLVGLSFAVI